MAMTLQFAIRFSYWSKFHVSIMTGFGTMKVFIFEGLTINLEIGNAPLWVLPNIWRLKWYGIPNLVQKKSFWILQNVRVIAFTVSELLWKNQLGIKLPSATTQIRDKIIEVNIRWMISCNFLKLLFVGNIQNEEVCSV